MTNLYRFTSCIPVLRPGVFILFFLFIWNCGHATSVTTNSDYVDGEVLIRFHELKTTADAGQFASRHGCVLKHHFGWLSQQEGKTMGLLHSTNRSTAALLNELQKDPDVEFAEPNYLRHFTDMRTTTDADFSQLWGLQNQGQLIAGIGGTNGADIGFLKAWGLARPSTNEVVVGVIDSGLDITHPDIVSNLWTNPGEIPGNGIDDDTNGYVDDVHGYDFALGTGTITDSGFHGTHVCGTIAATGNNGIGVIGVDFKAHIMMLKASTDGTDIDTASEIEGIQYATMMKGRGINVVALNASFGGGSSSSAEESAIQAAGNAGIIFCAAAGNSSIDHDTTPVYPASYRLNNMIVVAASDQNDDLASFSDYGANTVDLAAPGVDVLSLLPVAQYGNSTYLKQSGNTYSAYAITYSGVTSASGITATIYNCGLGNPTNFPAGVKNNIALIQRGTLTFASKVSNAMNAGAVAAIIFNNTNGIETSATLGSAGSWIPTLSISQADGLSLSGILPAAGTVVNFPDPTQIYQLLSGTSMATPHVSGAVAFAAMNFPTESVTQRIQRILNNVTPVPTLSGKVITGGRLNLAKMVDTDGNGLPDWWEQQYFGHLTGTDPSADPDHDGESNLAEFLAGTNPTNAASVLKLNTVSSVSANSVKFQWPSATGRYYRVLRSTNLVAGINTLVQTNLAAVPPLNSFTDTPPASKNLFYRIQLEPGTAPPN